VHKKENYGEGNGAISTSRAKICYRIVKTTKRVEVMTKRDGNKIPKL